MEMDNTTYWLIYIIGYILAYFMDRNHDREFNDSRTRYDVFMGLILCIGSWVTFIVYFGYWLYNTNNWSWKQWWNKQSKW